MVRDVQYVVYSTYSFVMCWEVVQLAVHQILDLIILVRVQASQPIFKTYASGDFRLRQL